MGVFLMLLLHLLLTSLNQVSGLSLKLNWQQGLRATESPGAVFASVVQVLL